MANNRINHKEASLRVCVNQIHKDQISGWVYSQCLEKPVVFNDVTNFLILMEDVFNKQDFPRAFQRKRSFKANHSLNALCSEENVPTMMKEEYVSKMWGEVFTFVIYVTARQNTTWQGRVDWLDGMSRQPFRSALELIRLIDRRIFQV